MLNALINWIPADEEPLCGSVAVHVVVVVVVVIHVYNAWCYHQVYAYTRNTLLSYMYLHEYELEKKSVIR